MQSLVRTRKFIILSIFCCFMIALWSRSFVIEHDMSSLIIWNGISINDDEKPYELIEDPPPYAVSTIGCRIPTIDPFDPIVKPFIKKMDLSMVQKICGKLPPLTHLTSDNQVVIDKSVFHLYGINDTSLLDCHTTAILTEIDNVKMDTYYYDSKNCSVDIDVGSMNVIDDQLRIQCNYNGTLIYTDFYATIQIHPELEERYNVLFQNTTMSRSTLIENGIKIVSPVDRLSILILTLDSVSNANVKRHMKKTAEYLTNTMGAVNMLGYNKLGDNTFPIIVTLLMGLSDKEVKKNCRSSDGKLDDCPFIWKEFSQRGYRTAFVEDSVIISAFSPLEPGFRKQPTDYYLRPVMMAEHRSVKRTPWNVNDYYCFAKRIQVPVLITYARDFAAKMRDKPHFGYFHSSGLTHDDMNWAQLVDPMVYEFLREGHEGNYFNNTVLMLMSDHGARFGPIRETYIGKLEESLPFFYLVFPPWFINKYHSAMQNLRTNARRLVSSYDIHETLKDILNSHYDRETPTTADSVIPERISLFDEIPESRTCSDANIPEHYCACQSIDSISNDKTVAIVASNQVVEKVNELTLSNRKLCSEYSLNHTLSIFSSKPTSAFTVDKRNMNMTTFAVIDYIVMVEVRPGNAKFEGTVRFMDNNIVGVLGDVSRIDRYGTTSACVSDLILRKYCWCFHQSVI